MKNADTAFGRGLHGDNDSAPRNEVGKGQP